MRRSDRERDKNYPKQTLEEKRYLQFYQNIMDRVKLRTSCEKKTKISSLNVTIITFMLTDDLPGPTTGAPTAPPTLPPAPTTTAGPVICEQAFNQSYNQFLNFAQTGQCAE